MYVDDPSDGEVRDLTGEVSFPILRGNDDVAAIYNILYRQLFDRHRDLSLPTSFLLDGNGNIVKVYQGPIVPDHVVADFQNIPQTDAQRLARASAFSKCDLWTRIRPQLPLLRRALFSARIS